MMKYMISMTMGFTSFVHLKIGEAPLIVEDLESRPLPDLMDVC